MESILGCALIRRGQVLEQTPNAWLQVELAINAAEGMYDISLDRTSTIRSAAFAEPAALDYVQRKGLPQTAAAPARPLERNIRLAFML